MQPGCYAFLEGWDRLVEKELMNRKNDEGIIDRICKKLTRACHNVDPKYTQRAPKVTIGGKPMDVSPDGSIKEPNEDL